MKLETVLSEAKKIINLGNGDWKSGSESGTVYNGKAQSQTKIDTNCQH